MGCDCVIVKNMKREKSKKNKSGERTLLASVILSSPGPIVVGAGLFVGRSSTQLADFIRRSAELVAIIVSLVIYRVTHKGTPCNECRRAELERIANISVGAAMCIGGVAMLLVSFLYTTEEKGNVIFGLIIAVLGVITNTWFRIRYRMLDKANPNAILAVQSRLYSAKALVDACVVAALVVVAVAPGSSAAYIADTAGSIAVAIYLIANGLLTALNKKTGKTIR